MFLSSFHSVSIVASSLCCMPMIVLPSIAFDTKHIISLHFTMCDILTTTLNDGFLGNENYMISSHDWIALMVDVLGFCRS